MTEEQLVQKCVEGSRDAQRELYARTADRIYKLMLRMTGRPEDASDLTQEVYIKVFGRIDQFKGGSRVATWITGVAINEARQFLRRQRIHDLKLSVLKGLRQSTVESGPDLETADTIQHALSRMPVFERALIVLRHMNELSYAEISELLDKPPGTIASSLNRARHMLREILENKSTICAKIPAVDGI